MSNFYNQASWVLVPSGIEEDIVFAQKPTSGLGDLTFTRASDATYTDSTGVVRRSPYNLLLQSEDFSNVAWGKAGSGVAAPVVTANQSLSPTGTNTADKIVFPAVSTATNYSVVYNSTPLPTSGSNTASVYLKGEVGGEKVYVFMTVGSTWTNLLCTLTTEWQRFTFPFTGGANSYFHIGLDLRAGSGQVAQSGSTIYAWGAQLVEGTSALDYFPTTNRQDVPRIDFRNADGTLNSCPRLLLEPQRTNSIRNSTMVGAVAGSPGTLPTNWNVGTSGLTQTIVSVGTEDGLPYIDLRVNGTSTGTSVLVGYEGQVFTTAAQSWTNSAYIKIVNAPSPPVSYRLLYVVRGAATTFPNQAITPTTTLSRFAHTLTTPTGTTSVQPYFEVILTNGATYDFTIRIAAPQMELGVDATTFTPTTTAAVTRLVDLASKTGVSSIIGQTEGTIFIDLEYNKPSSDSNGRLLIIQNSLGETTSSILPLILNSNRFQLAVYATGVVSFPVPDSLSTVVPFGRQKFAVAYNNGSYTVYRNGSLFASGTGGAPSSLSVISLGNAIGFTRSINNPINQAALFPTRLTNAQLAQLTTL
jgi:hypothetical protein